MKLFTLILILMAFIACDNTIAPEEPLTVEESIELYLCRNGYWINSDGNIDMYYQFTKEEVLGTDRAPSYIHTVTFYKNGEYLTTQRWMWRLQDTYFIERFCPLSGRYIILMNAESMFVKREETNTIVFNYVTGLPNE